MRSRLLRLALLAVLLGAVSCGLDELSAPSDHVEYTVTVIGDSLNLVRLGGKRSLQVVVDPALPSGSEYQVELLADSLTATGRVDLARTARDSFALTGLAVGMTNVRARITAPDLAEPLVSPAYTVEVDFAGVRLRTGVDTLHSKGETTPIVVEGLDAGGQPRDTLSWAVTTGAPTIVGISGSQAMAVRNGGSWLKVESPKGDLRDSVRLVVLQVAKTVITPHVTFTLTALNHDTTIGNLSVLDARGQVVDSPKVSWSSSAPGQVRVDSVGRIRGLVPNGEAFVSATVDGVSDQTKFEVRQRVAFLVVESGGGQSDTAGQVLPAVVQVQARDLGGSGVPAVHIAFRRPDGSSAGLTPQTAVTDAAGRATLVAWQLRNAVGVDSVYVLHDDPPPSPLPQLVSAIVVPDRPSSITPLTPLTGFGTVGTTPSTLPAVKVTDQFGNPTPGVGLSFGLTGGGSLSGVPSTTNSAGVASVGGWTLGTTAGPNSVVVTVGALSPVSFTRTGTAAAPTQFVVDSGQGETIVAGDSTAVVPLFRLTDQFGNGVDGVAVTFAPSAGAVQALTASTLNGGKVRPGGRWFPGTVAGPRTLVATAGGLNAVLTVNVLSAAADSIVVVGQPRDTISGAPLIPLGITVTDRFENRTPLTGTAAVQLLTAAGTPLGGASTVTVTAGQGTVTGFLVDSIGDGFRLRVTVAGVPKVSTTSAFAVRSGITSVSVSPGSVALRSLGDTLRLTLAAANQIKPITGRPSTWTSTAAGVVSVSASGLVQAIQPGTASVIAMVDGVADTISVTVAQAVATLTFALDSTVLQFLGDTVRIPYTLTDSGGATIVGRRPVWTSLSPGLATVDTNGLVRATGDGVGRVVGALDGRADTVIVAVLREPAALAFAPVAVSVDSGATAPIPTITPYDSVGASIPSVGPGGFIVPTLTGSDSVADTSVAAIVGGQLVGRRGGFTYLRSRRGMAIDSIGVTVSTPALPDPVIVVTAPGAGDLWRWGETRQVCWTATDVPGVIVIRLSGPQGLVFDTVPAGTGCFPVTVPELPSDTGYKVEVVHWSTGPLDPGEADASESFEIRSAFHGLGPVVFSESFHAEGAPAANSDEEIVLVDATGGVRRLTTNAVQDVMPSLSPDGTRIVYSSGNGPTQFEIWVMDTNGANAKQLTTHTGRDLAPVWSPDGSRIAWSRDHQLFLMFADGTGQRDVGLTGDSPVWVNDSVLYFDNAGIHRVNVDSAGSQTFVRPGRSPAISGDRLSLAVVVSDAIEISDLLGQNSYPPLLVGGNPERPAFSADGSTVIYQQSVSVDTAALFAVAVTQGATGPFVQLTPGGALGRLPGWVPGPSAPIAGALATARVSIALDSIPFGGSTAVTADIRDFAFRPTSGVVTWKVERQDVAMVDPSGIVTAVGAGRTAVWSEVGGRRSNQILLTVLLPPSPPGPYLYSSDANGDFEVVIQTDQNATPVPLTSNAANDRAGGFSPDRAWIVFASDRTGDAEIWTMRADGTQQSLLVAMPGADDAPAWSPDGRWIAWEHANAELWVAHPDGSGLRQVPVTGGSGLLYDPKWIDDSMLVIGRSSGDLRRVDINGRVPESSAISIPLAAGFVQGVVGATGTPLVFRTGDGNLHRSDLGSGTSVPITDEGSVTPATGPVFSSDGGWALFQRGYPSYRLAAVPLAGGSIVDLSPAGANGVTPGIVWDGVRPSVGAASTVTISFPVDTLPVGGTVTAIADIRDFAYQTTSGAPDWHTSDQDVATVDAGGVVTGVGPGVVDIWASIGARTSGRVRVVVGLTDLIYWSASGDLFRWGGASATPTNLTHTGAVRHWFAASTSPTGRSLLYTELTSPLRVMSLDLNTGGSTPVIADGADNVGGTWSRRGSWIAWRRDLELWVRRGDGGGERRLASGEILTIDWADDTLVVFSTRDGVFKIRADGVPDTDVVQVVSQGSSYYQAAVSPNGQWLAWRSPNQTIWKCELAACVPIQLTQTGRESSPTWTPDGGGIVFEYSLGSGWPGLQFMRADGTGRAILIAQDGMGAVSPVFPRLPLALSAVRVGPMDTVLGAPGDTVRFAARGVDTDGRLVTRGPVIWNSSDTMVARVTDGLVTAVGTGAATITATIDGIVGSTLVLVNLAGAVRPVPLATGLYHACALNSQGKAYCWGSNVSGQLGTTAGGASNTPVAVQGGHTFVSLAAGNGFNCGLTPVGGAYCWGENDHGEFGDGTTSGADSPVAAASGMIFRALIAGTHHACGLTFEGRVYCWGLNDRGQLGNGTTIGSLTPREVVDAPAFSSLGGAGEYGTCGVARDGTGYCWGAGFYGAIGDGTTDDALVPKAVVSGQPFVTVGRGDDHSCGLTTGGMALCWGRNWEGELGREGYDIRLPPDSVAAGGRYVSLAVGRYHACGLTAGGGADCWGWSSEGALGDDGASNGRAAAAVSGGYQFAAIAAGYRFTCGRTLTGATLCWGSNGYGQVGDGVAGNRLTPAEVVIP